MTAIEVQARSIFLAALDLSPEGWPALLDESCGGDAELRARVEQLLRAHQAMGSIHGVAADATTDVAVEERPGSWVGRYKLLEPIGEGGFGLVFMAEQTQPVRRKVALKVIKPGMDTRQVVARFEAERQALALMDHPSIAKVLDAGETEGGRPFFVMELIRGIPITDYCEQNRLSPRECLWLFVPVCQAVQHAHQKGVIHRDLKPSNVLVTLHDGVPVAKVIDFGIAKALGQQLTEKTLFTGFTQMIGTPLYMSPEQAALSAVDVDTRSDVYSLGVLLYKLLTGTTPIAEERLKELSYDEIRRVIREEEPPRPSTRLSTLGQATTLSGQRTIDPKRLSQMVRGELDWIVMKCLEKDRNRRYESASDLARDVERFLRDEPVLACPPSAWYRLRKLVRRHRGRVAAAGVVLLCLVVGIAGTVAGLARAVHEADRACQARDAEAEQHRRAEDNLRLALRVLDDIYLQIAEDRVPRDARQERRGHELLNRALAFYQEFAARNSADPVVALEVARARRRVGDILRLMGKHAEARGSYLAAIEQAGQTAGHAPGEPEFARELAACRNALGELDLESGDLASATDQFGRAAAAVTGLGRDSAAAPGDRAELARSGYGLGQVLRQRGDRFGAEAQFRVAIDLQTRLAEECHKVARYRADLARMHRGAAGWDRAGPGDEQAAAAHLRTAVRLTEALVNDFPTEPLYRQELGIALEELATYVGPAVENFQRAIDVQSRLVAEFPTVPAYRRDLAGSYINLGDHHFFCRREHLAAEPWRLALELTRKLAEEYPDVAKHQSNFAVSLWNSAQLALVRERDLGRANKLLEQAVTVYRSLLTAYPENQRYVYLRTANCLLLSGGRAALGDQAGAEKWRREAEDTFCDGLAALDRLPGGPVRTASLSHDVADELGFHVSLWERAGRPAEAAAVNRQGTGLFGRALARFPGNPGVWLGRGEAHRRLGRLDDALDDYQRAAGLLEEAAKTHGTADNRKQLTTCLNSLTDLLTAKDRLGEAEATARKAVAWWRSLAADLPQEQTNRFEVGGALGRLGKVLAAARRHREAEEAFREAAAVFATLAAESTEAPGYLVSEANTFSLHLGPLLAGERGRAGDAEEAYRRGIQAGERLAARFPSLNPEYHRRLGDAYQALMDLLRNDGRPDAATQVGRGAVEFYTRLAAQHPNESSIQAELVRRNRAVNGSTPEAGRPAPPKPK